MKAGMKTALRTTAWSASALLMMGAAGTAAAATHHAKHATSTDTTDGQGPQSRPKLLHDLATVQASDGTFEQYATQIGKVGAVSDSSITVVSADEYSATYAIDGDTVVLKNGKKATTADVAAGDTVMVRAEDEDGTFTAHVIGDGKPPAGRGPGGPGGGHRPPPPGAPGAGGPGAPGGAPGDDGDGT